MTKPFSNVQILSKSIGMNGPSMGFGVPFMVIGFVTFIGGLANLSALATGIGAALLVFAALLIISIDCIAIDQEQKKLHLYKDYFILKSGDWISWTDYTSVSIYYEIDRPINSRRNWNTTQLKTFEVYLTSANGKLLIKEFGDVNAAKKLQNMLAQNTGLKVVPNPIREIKIQ